MTDYMCISLHRIKKAATLAAACLWVLSGLPAIAASCAQSDEIIALNAQVLKSELMVAALSCNQRSGYNQFVQRFGPQLAEHGDSLRRYFKRIHGEQGEKKLNQFITRLANDLSKRSLSAPLENYCAAANILVHNAANLQAGQFYDFVSDRYFSSTHGIEPCR